MKRSTLLAALFLLVSVAAFANVNALSETSSFKVIAKADLKYDLYYVSESEGPVTVRIYDAKGNMITDDKIKNQKAFKKTYNFKELANGNYKIVVNNQEGRASQAVFHNPSPTKMQIMITQIPESKSFRLHVGDFDTSKPLTVKVYTANNRLIFSEQINETAGFSKVYNLNKVDAETVRFTVSNNKESLSHYRSL